ncbi:MAG: hypothetical protein H8E62_09990 [Planctomycetes bacterium]|nr:hypothetical protein [Planctomycetota bacterium]
MSKKKNILLILESQVDKIVLGVIVLVSLVLLWMYVIGNPYGQKIRLGGSEVSVSPGNVDEKIRNQSQRLLEELEQPSQMEEYRIYDKTYATDYKRQFQCAVLDLPANLAVPYPGVGDVLIEEERLYTIPPIPPLEDIQTAILRGAAQVPVEEVTPGNPYDMVEIQVADIDLVTVSARFDFQKLYYNYQLSFNGPGLKSSWKDARLAKPVFARIELQRRAVEKDGSPGPWTVVPRTKVDSYKKLLEQLPMTSEQMQFGVNVWMSQYETQAVQFDILQPEPYLFSISRSEWMPPEYLIESLEILKKEADQLKRKLSEERKAAREVEQRGGDRMGRSPGRPQPPTARPRLGQETTTEQAARTRKTERERTITDVQRDIQKDTLKAGSRLDSNREPLLVWAHDDTAQPGQTYEYRIRLGVFNPIMGKDWFRKEQAGFKNQLVLWSDYLEVPDLVEVPRMQHIFPMETLAKKDGIKVEIAKYYMGQWKMQEFDVYPGQVMGYLAEDDQSVDPQDRPVTDESTPTMIDFTSGMTLVDLIKEITWNKRLKRSDYYAMLYFDGEALNQVAVGKSNWPSDYSKAYRAVQEEMDSEASRIEGDFNMPPGIRPGIRPGMPPGFGPYP